MITQPVRMAGWDGRQALPTPASPSSRVPLLGGGPVPTVLLPQPLEPGRSFSPGQPPHRLC